MSSYVRTIQGRTISISDYHHIAEELGHIFGYTVKDHCTGTSWDYITSVAYDEGRQWELVRLIESGANMDDFDHRGWPANYQHVDWDLTIVPSTPGVVDASDQADWYAATDAFMETCESVFPISFDPDGPHDTQAIDGTTLWYHGLTIEADWVSYDEDNERPDSDHYTHEIPDKGYYRTSLTRVEIDGVCGPEWEVYTASKAWDMESDHPSLWLMLVPVDPARFK